MDERLAIDAIQPHFPDLRVTAVDFDGLEFVGVLVHWPDRIFGKRLPYNWTEQDIDALVSDIKERRATFG